MQKIMEKFGLIDSGSAHQGSSVTPACAIIIPSLAALSIVKRIEKTLKLHHRLVRFIFFAFNALNSYLLNLISFSIHVLNNYLLIKNNNPQEVGEDYG